MVKQVRVSTQKLREFIKSQPDDKTIEWNETNFHYPCGCLFVQYAKHTFPDSKIGYAGLAHFTICDNDYRPRVEINFPIYYNTYGKPKTFGELKEVINAN